jgi:bifunctional UDP-N-acetylglucosamine pyrophosphorylase/glucosamine-1-phosphate N-acetyltransferase
MNNLQLGVVILAAGEGKRMKSTTPKVMTLLHGRPLIDHVVTNVEAANLGVKPVVVVSAKHTLVQEYLGDRATYVVQSEPKGTGHAVSAAESVLSGKAEHVVVLYGDMPFLRPDSIARLAHEHVDSGATLSLLTAETPDFDGWRAAFRSFGRIVRDSSGYLERIVEYKDASDAERESLRELSTCYFCFRGNWLWQQLKNLKNENVQQEFYLTDLVSAAIRGHEKITLSPVALEEVIGVNTPEDLSVAEGM